jgi:GMP synthase-like glutamine amidotransferase
LRADSVWPVRALAIVHQADAGPGVFAEEIRRRGWDLDEWLIPDSAEPPADPFGYDAVLTFGGAMNVEDRDRHRWIDREIELLAELLERATPLLGACLGTQLLAEAAGGEVRRAPRPEIGWFPVEVEREANDDPLFGPLLAAADGPSVAGGREAFEAFQWHSYEAIPPRGAVALARSAVCNQAYRLDDRAWGIQFHAEVGAANALRWIADWRSDPDAVGIGLDPDALRTETEERIDAWNRCGRELCGRFLDAVG